MNAPHRHMHPLLPLSMLPTGQQARVVEVRGGQSCLGRLTSLGILPGASVAVVRNTTSGPVIVKLHGSRLALGRGLSHQIMVTVEV